MIEKDSAQWLAGKRGLVVGVANDKSIAWGCAKAFHQMGAELALTYQNEKTKTYTEPLAQQVNTSIFQGLDVTVPGSLEAVFDTIRQKWGKLDFLLHAIAFAPGNDLHGRVVDCSKEGFALALDISCHSFIRMAKLAEPLMTDGGSLLTLTYHGSTQVVHDYNMMGPVKAALESTVRYLAAELGPKNIRVNAVSPGPIATRAGSGIQDFDKLLAEKQNSAPTRHLSTTEDIGWQAAFLASNRSGNITGQVAYVDGGASTIG